MPKVESCKKILNKRKRYAPFNKRSRRRFVGNSLTSLQSSSVIEISSTSVRQSSSHARENLNLLNPMGRTENLSGYADPIPFFGRPRQQSSDVEVVASSGESTGSDSLDGDSYIPIYNIVADEHMVPRRNKSSIMENLNNPILVNCPFKHGIANVRHKQLMENYEDSSDVNFLLPAVPVAQYMRRTASKTSFVERFRRIFRRQ